MTRSAAVSALFLASLLTLPDFAAAQGRGVQFLNFEAPPHAPIEVVKVGGRDYLLVANAPDNAVEVYETVNHQLLFRVPTGQRPVTVAVRPSETPSGGRQIYVANWLGDSITVFDLEPSSGAAPVRFSLVTTEYVGDEPVGITFVPENPFDPLTQPGGPLHELVLVTFSGPAQWGSFQPGTLNPVVGQMELMHALSSTITHAVRDPRAIAFAPPPMHDGPYEDQLWILNHRGGNDAAIYDFDLWGTDDLVASAGSGFSTLPAQGQLGTTNTQMAFDDGGDLWVVGIAARNKDPALGNPNLAVGEPIHQGMVLNETGFTKSFLARYSAIDTQLAVPQVLDLNNAVPGASPPTQAAVPVANPTDLAIYEDSSGRTRVFVTGYGSDTLAMVTPSAGGVSSWGVTRISVAHPTNAFDATNTAGVMRGPRGLALKAGPVPSDQDRLYVYNRVDQSVTVIAANANPPTVIQNFSLANDPEPPRVKDGRKFLVSTELSGGRNVSCWSCHIDGNTDFLGWNLEDGHAIPGPSAQGALLDALGPNSNRKGVMVTQPLRGLVNFEVAGNGVQDLFFSNRPYHWRGDQGFLEHFNAAFVNLMGMPNLEPNPPNPGHHRGLSVADMTAFREFTFSIHYPPNPNQPWRRQYTGTMFDAQSPPQTPDEEVAQINDPDVGTGGQLGLKIFHSASTVNAFNCTQCHFLPEGSNNVLTETFANVEAQVPNRIETAQTKGLTYKERVLVRAQNNQLVTLPTTGSPATTHEFGLVHGGKNDLGIGFFADSVGGFVSGFGFTPSVALAVSLYMREFDSGTGPLVGFTSTVDVAAYTANPSSPAFYATQLGLREDQVKAANAGLAVHASVAGQLHGFWYDVTDSTTPYHEISQPGVTPIGNLGSAGLLNLLGTPSAPSDFLTFHFTPLGSERRVADLGGGHAGWLPGSAPSGVSLLPARPMSANARVPDIAGPAPGGQSFDELVDNPQFYNQTPSAKLITVAHYEKSLITHAPSFGLTAERFDAPRRLRVTGDGIQDGALLLVRAPTAAGTPSTPPAVVPPFGSTITFTLPLYPTNDGAEVVWETAVEIEPLYLFALMNGGPFNPTVTQIFFDPKNLNLWFSGASYLVETQDLMQPMSWNWYYVQVVNQTSTGPVLSPGAWQRITID